MAFTTGKEVSVKSPENGPRQLDRRLDQPSEVRLGSPNSADSPTTPLSEDEKSVLGCLRKAGGGLTIRQLQIRSSCSAAECRIALDGLLRRELAGQLNTLVPSYFSK